MEVLEIGQSILIQLCRLINFESSMNFSNKIHDYIDLGSTIRSCSAKDTLEKLNKLLKVLGITRVADVTRLDNIGIPVAICIRPNSKHLAVSQGKGYTWELAKISAIMESIESYHAENGVQPALRDTYSCLKKDYLVVSPARFNPGHFSISDLEERKINWVQAIDINQQNQAVYIPHALTCLDSTKLHSEYNYLSVSSNGLAAGNSLDEAICHALYEIIERDSLAIWSRLNEKKLKEKQLLLASIDSEINSRLIEQLSQADQFIKIWDITSEIGVPSFHCVIKDSNPISNLGMFRGTGCHVSKEIALSRALMEAAQSRLSVISGSRDDIFNDQYHQKKTYTYSQQEYEGVKCYSDCLQPTYEKNFGSNVKMITSLLMKKGYKNIYLVNQTKPSIEVPVVHIFIPGMKYNGATI